MRSTLDELNSSLREIAEFVGSIKPVGAALAGSPDTEIRQYLAVRRRFDYSAFVVAVYSAFERFIEDLVWSRAEADSKYQRYAELPDPLRRKNLRVSAELLAKGRWGEGRYTGMKEVDVVTNLHKCLVDAGEVSLIRHAVVHHDANLRAPVIDTCFNDIGVPTVVARACASEAMRSWYARAQGLQVSEVERVPDTAVSLLMEDVVERRNQIAHSGGTPTEFLSPERMLEQVEFVQAFSRGIYGVVAGDYLHRRYVLTQPARAFGPVVEGPFMKGTVVVVPRPEFRVAKNQAVFAVVNGVVDRWGYVQSLRVDDQEVDEVLPEAPSATVGIRTPFRLSDGVRLFVLEKPDDLVWG